MKVETWGEVWHEEIPRSRDNLCPECGDGTFGCLSIENIQKNIVGCDTGCSYSKVRAIFKCPKCGGLFWFHIDLVLAEWAFESMESK